MLIFAFWVLFTYLYKQKLEKEGSTQVRAFVVAGVAMAIPAAVASGIFLAIIAVSLDSYQ